MITHNGATLYLWLHRKKAKCYMMSDYSPFLDVESDDVRHV